MKEKHVISLIKCNYPGIGHWIERETCKHTASCMFVYECKHSNKMSSRNSSINFITILKWFVLIQHNQRTTKLMFCCFFVVVFQTKIQLPIIHANRERVYTS